jgi:hypothetical protein
LKKLYGEVIKMELQEEIDKLKERDLKTYSVKYLGITDGQIGILSRKLPF